MPAIIERIHETMPDRIVKLHPSHRERLGFNAHRSNLNNWMLTVSMNERERMRIRIWLRRKQRISAVDVLQKFYGLTSHMFLVSASSRRHEMARIFQHEGFCRTTAKRKYGNEIYTIFERPRAATPFDHLDALF